MAGYADCRGDFRWLIIHQDNVSGLNRRIRTETSHSYADIRAGKHRGVVDAISDECQSRAGRFLRNQPFDGVHLVRRQKFSVVFIQSELRSHVLAHLLTVARQHHRILHSERL